MSLMFVPIGREIRERKWPISGSEDAVVCRYKYFRVLTSDLGFSYKLKWFLASNLDQEITQEKIKHYFPNKQPRLGVWEHYALFIIFVSLLAANSLFTLFGF